MAKAATTPPADRPTGWRAYQREIQFLVLFVVLLGGGFALIAWQPVNDRVVVPFTAAIAKVSASILDLFGQETTMNGTRVYGKNFAVDIENGCNGIEALIIFLSATLSFPASWKARLAGLGIGTGRDPDRQPDPRGGAVPHRRLLPVASSTARTPWCGRPWSSCSPSCCGSSGRSACAAAAASGVS